MKASVVIPAYNASKTLPIVLQSLQNQDFRDFEITLVDDGSTDDTSSIAKRNSGHLDLRVVRNSENQGRAKARNLGVGQSHGEVIILLDSDIEIVQNYISIHLHLHKNSAGSVGIGALRYPPHLAKKALAHYYSSRGGARLKPGQALPGKYFVSGLASFPRALFDEVGGFDERFKAYGSEDLELGLRFQAAGAQFHYLPDAIGYHHHLRPLKEVMAILHQYGREGIPVLLEKHPDFASDLHLDDLTGSAKDRGLASLLRRLLTAAALFHPAVEIASLLQNLPLPSPLLTYLHYAAYRRGILEYLADMPNPIQNLKSKIL